MSKEGERLKRGRRISCEFGNFVKMLVRARSEGNCEVCKTRKASQFHHITPVAQAVAEGYDPSRIKSFDNCQHVCDDCHRKIN